MPEIISELFATVAAVEGGDVIATVRAQGTDADDVIVSADVDLSVGQAAHGGVTQRVTLGVSVNGSEVDQANLLSGLNVSRSHESMIQEAAFAVPLGPNGEGLFGSPFDYAGPPTGKKTISVFGVYETSTGRHTVPILTDGVAETSERSDDGGYIESFTVSDRGARFDRKKVSIAFPPGHGFNRDEMAAKILELAGEQRNRLEPMAQAMKELALSKGEPLSVIQDALMDIEHRVLLWDREGYPYNPKLGPPTADEYTAWTFTAADLYARERVRVGHKADVITKVIATGNSQELLATCDPVSSQVQIPTHAIYAPRSPFYLQTTSPYASNPQAPASDTPILVELKIVETTTRCETVVRTRTKTYGWFNPETSRYQWDATNDEWDRIGPVYTDTNLDDDQPAYKYFSEHWCLISEEDVREYYFENGFQIAWSSGMYPELVNLMLPVGQSGWESDPVTGDILDPKAGIKLGTHRLLWQYIAPREAMKTRSFPYQTPWDEVEPTNGTLVLGNKERAMVMSNVHPETLNFTDRGEVLALAQEDIEILEPYDAEGRFLRARTTHTRAWDVRPGGVIYFYGEDFTSNQAESVYRKVREESEVYVGVGDDQHNVIRTAYDRDGRETDGLPDELGLGGWLPAMDRLPNTAPAESLYADDAEIERKHREARRVDQKQIKVEVEAEDLLGAHEENEVEADLEWAENEEELDFNARMMIHESAAVPVSFTLAGFNAFVLEATKIRLTYSPLGLDHDMRVQRVSHSGGYPDGPLLTRVECLLYGWEG